MLNRAKIIGQNARVFLSALAVIMLIPFSAGAEDAVQDTGAQSVSDYKIDDSMFKKITDFEQEKLLMQIEKEKAQLDLDLDRLAAEKIRLQMDIENITNKSAEQQAKLEADKQKLEEDKKKFESEKANLNTKQTPATPAAGQPTQNTETANANVDSNLELSKKYKLTEILGAGNQLQAMLEDLENGQNKKVVTGKIIEGYKIQSISLDEGVVFFKDGETQILNISK